MTLDGVPDEDGKVRASYQPGGLLGDDENNIVHTETWSQSDLWFPWVAAAATGATTWYYQRQWRRVGGQSDASAPEDANALHARGT